MGKSFNDKSYRANKPDKITRKKVEHKKKMTPYKRTKI